MTLYPNIFPKIIPLITIITITVTADTITTIMTTIIVTAEMNIIIIDSEIAAYTAAIFKKENKYAQ